MMKKCLKVIFLFGFNLTFLLTSYSQVKQVSNFKSIKKTIDTLTYLAPHVFIESISKSISETDTSLITTISNQLSKKISSSLKQKYFIKNSLFQLQVYQDNEITIFFNKLDSIDKVLIDIDVPKWLNSYDSSTTSQYVLAIFFYGFYYSEFEPYFITKQSLRTNYILLNPPMLYGSSIRIVIADKQTNTILYYNNIKSKHCDPRITSEVEKLISDIIKPIYYK